MDKDIKNITAACWAQVGGFIFKNRHKWQVMADIRNQPFFGREKNPVVVKFRRPIAYMPEYETQLIADYNRLNSDAYKNLIYGDWKPDQRMIDLEDRLQQYYDQTPYSMSNKDARPYWMEFREWCDTHGYTSDEISKAKKAKKNLRQIRG